MHMSDLVVSVWGTLYKDGIPLEKFKEAYEIADNIAHIALTEDESATEPDPVTTKLRNGTKIHKVYQALVTGPKSVNELRKASGAATASVYGYVKQLKAKRHELNGTITYSLQ